MPRARLLDLALIAAAVLIIYAGAINYPYAFDDFPNIVENPIVTGAQGRLAPAVEEHRVARGIGYASFRAEHIIAGDLSPAWSRSINIALHVCAAFALYFLVVEISGNGLAALIASLVFACHPLQSASVTYIVQRFSLLSGLFSLLAIIFYLKARRMGWMYELSLLAAVIATASRESAFMLPFLILLFDVYFYHERSMMARLKRIAPFFVISLFILAAHLPFTGLFERATAHSGIGLRDHFIMLPAVELTYIRLVLLPINQSLEYGHASWIALPAIAAAMFALPVLRGKGSRVCAAGLIFFFVAQGVDVLLMPLEPVFEHRMYLPLAGVSVFAGAALASVMAHRRAVLAIAACMIVLMGTLALERNRIWVSDVSLWTDAANKAPLKPRPHNNLALALMSQGDYAGAERELELALKLDDSYQDARLNIGALYLKTERPAEALMAFDSVMNTAGATALNGRGSALFALGRIAEAQESFSAALDREPGHVNARANLGGVYLRMGLYEAASRELLVALSANPAHAGANNSMGVLLDRLGRRDEAKNYFMRALQSNPLMKEARENLRALEAEAR